MRGCGVFQTLRPPAPQFYLHLRHFCTLTPHTHIHLGFGEVGVLSSTWWALSAVQFPACQFFNSSPPPPHSLPLLPATLAGRCIWVPGATLPWMPGRVLARWGQLSEVALSSLPGGGVVLRHMGLMVLCLCLTSGALARRPWFPGSFAPWLWGL